MEAKSYSRLAAAIFALIGLLQLGRALAGWVITINGTPLPVWPSWVAGGLALVFAWVGFSVSRT